MSRELKIVMDILFIGVCILLIITEIDHHWGDEPARAISIGAVILVALMKGVGDLVRDLLS